MKYRALKPLIYSGISYEAGAEVNILEKSVVKSCLERELIEEIKDTAEKVVSKVKEVAEDAKDAVEGAIEGVKNMLHKDEK